METPDRVAAEYFRILGLLRIADAECEGGPRLPLIVLNEWRDWPWEPPVVIESNGAILAALETAVGEVPLMMPLSIDGRLYVLQEFNGRPSLSGRLTYDVARWELATSAMVQCRTSTAAAWDAWHFPRPHELELDRGVWRAAAWKLARMRTST